MRPGTFDFARYTSLRNGFNGFLRALLGDRACLPPSPAEDFFRQLDASVGASGPHDFTVRVSAPRPARHPRPPHPAPNVRDDREPPLLRERDGDRYAGDLGVLKTGKFLRRDLDS